MKKIVVVLLILILAGIGIWVYRNKKSSPQADAGKSVIRIGVSLPLSGDIADIGQTNMASLEMAINKWKEKDTKYTYELIFEDDAFSSKQAAINANKFISVDKAKAILSMWAVAGLPIADIANKSKVISFACAGGANTAKPEYALNNFTQVKEAAEAMAKKLKEENVGTVAYFINLSTFADELIGALNRSLAEKNIEIVSKTSCFNHLKM